LAPVVVRRVQPDLAPQVESDAIRTLQRFLHPLSGGYQNTEIGQVIVLAYLDAYKKLVAQLGGYQAAPPPAH